MLALLLACSSPPPAAPAFTPDLAALAGAERACVEKHCAAAADAAAHGACRAERCAATPAVWAVKPALLRYDAGTVTMSVAVEHTPGAYGDVPAPAEGETFLGATVLTRAGEEIDMAVHTVFPDRLGEPFTFVSEVGPDVNAVIVGLWGKKVEPCDSTRSGCKMFGFVLDRSLAAYPAETYVATPPRRQRFLPATMRVGTRTDAPGDARQVEEALAAALAKQTERFGTAFTRLPVAPIAGSAAPAADTTTGAVAPAASAVVTHKDPNDGPVATELAEAVAGAAKLPVKACHDPAAAADFVVDLAAAPPDQAACR